MIIFSGESAPTPPVEPVKSEPLSKTASTSITATDDARLNEAASTFRVSRAAVLRAALSAHLDKIETK